MWKRTIQRERRRRSELQEGRTADSLGGRTQKASGATAFAKGDVRVTREVRAECKTTEHKSYILKLSDWKKLQAQAVSGGLEAPVMQIEFQGAAGQNVKLAVIDWAYFLELRNSAKLFVDGEEPTLFEDGVDDPL